MTQLTDTEFASLSWHDCHIWRIDFLAGDSDQGDWTSDLAISLDFIVNWVCDPNRRMQFMIAPAILQFHGVTDPRIGIDWGDSGFRAAIHELSIARIDREPIINQQVFLDRPYYRWTVRLNWPEGGEISFGAVGFTQTLLTEPALCEAQHLSPRERARMLRHPG